MGSWLVGGGLLQSSTQQCTYTLSQYRTAPVVGPSQRAQPWNPRNSICTYGGTTDSCCVQYMHVHTSTRLTNGIVSSRYQIEYRGHSRQALVSNFLTFRTRFPRVNVSTPAAGRVICQCQSPPLGFQRPLGCRLFSCCKPQANTHRQENQVGVDWMRRSRCQCRGLGTEGYPRLHGCRDKDSGYLGMLIDPTPHVLEYDKHSK